MCKEKHQSNDRHSTNSPDQDMTGRVSVDSGTGGRASYTPPLPRVSSGGQCQNLQSGTVMSSRSTTDSDDRIIQSFGQTLVERCTGTSVSSGGPSGVTGSDRAPRLTPPLSSSSSLCGGVNLKAGGEEDVGSMPYDPEADIDDICRQPNLQEPTAQVK